MVRPPLSWIALTAHLIALGLLFANPLAFPRPTAGLGGTQVPLAPNSTRLCLVFGEDPARQAYTDREGVIERFTLDLTFDPTWSLSAPEFTEHYVIEQLQPGRWFVVSLPLRYTGADTRATPIEGPFPSQRLATLPCSGKFCGPTFPRCDDIARVH